MFMVTDQSGRIWDKGESLTGWHDWMAGLETQLRRTSTAKIYLFNFNWQKNIYLKILFPQRDKFRSISIQKSSLLNVVLEMYNLCPKRIE